MKRLYIVRHSRAGHISRNILDDQQRNLTQKGMDICPAIAKYVNSLQVQPQLILTSNANRTKQTADIIKAHLVASPVIIVKDELYLAL